MKKAILGYVGIVMFWSITIAFMMVIGFGAYGSLEDALAQFGPTEHYVFVSMTPLELRREAAITLYGQKANDVWSLVGDDEMFQQQVLRYGPELLVPLIWTYVWKPDVSLDFGATLKVKNLFRALVGGEKLSPRERALWVVTRVDQSGENFLRRYVVPDPKEGTVRLVRSKVAFAVPEDRLARNIERIDTKVQMGQEVTREDMVKAAAEAATIVFGVGLIGKMAGASSATRAAVYVRAGDVGGVRGFLGATAASLPRSLGEKALKWSVVGLGGYLVFTHPSVVTTAFGELAKFIGVSPAVGMVVGWALLIAIVLNLLWPLIVLVRGLLRFMPRHKKTHSCCKHDHE